MRHPSREVCRRLASLASLFLALLAWDPTAGAQGPPAPRARIGLALGGGSARGFTHIGILKWMHEHRIPIDLIGGTSMGALVGGGLATGMLPDEVEALVRSTDWARMLAPDAPFQDKTFRRKEDSRAFPSLIEFGLKHGFSLPNALSPGQQASLFLSRIALPYHGHDRFVDLPIPFACVAVDLQTSEAVVLDSGALEDALRASMAIPGVFTPVRIGDRVLVDGGLLNNVPADVVKGMGADVVIAVDVGRDLSNPKQSDSLLRVLVEALDVVMRAGARKALAAADIVIEPDLKGLMGSDFGRVPDFLRQGYQAAETNRDRLLPLALSEEAYRAHIEARLARRRTAVPTPTILTVDGVTGAQASVIRRQLQPHVDRPLDPVRLERDITLLTGSDRYDSITYRITTTGGRTVLAVTAREQPNAPPYLRGALDVSNVEASSVTAALRGRLTFFDVVTPGSELRLDAGVGRPSRAAAEWYLAVGSHGLFVAPRASYLRDQQGFMMNGRVVAEYRFDTYEAAADAGLTLGHDFELRAGYARERVSSQLRVGDPILPEFTGAQRYWRARAVFDGQSNPVVPDHGLYLRGELRRFTETAKLADPDVLVSFREPDELTIGEVRTSYFASAGRHGRLFAAGGGGWAFRDHTILNAFSLGGPFELSALQQDEVRGSNYVLANAGYLHEVARLLEGAAGRAYVGGWIENGAVFEHVDDAHVRTNFSAGLIVETVIGPAFFVGSVGTDGRGRLYVGLGQVFRH